MAERKRPSSEILPTTTAKRSRRQEKFESQDIWKNLDRIRTQNANAESIIKNSHLFIPIFSKSQDYGPRIDALHEYIESTKLQLHRCPGVVPAYVVLQNFSLMDCCLVLSVLFGFENKKWVMPSNASEYFSIPREASLSGCFYLPSSCTWHESNHVPIRRSQFQTNYNFKEYYVDLPNHTILTQFVRSLLVFFSDVKFGKSSKITSKHFARALADSYDTADLGVREMPFLGEGLFNLAELGKANLPLIEKAKTNMLNYAEDLIKYNSAAFITGNEASTPRVLQSPKSQQISKQQQQQQQQRQTPMRTASGAAASRPHFMTQEQIKQHCIATIRASQDLIKTKSSYQILKTYVKCPRQGYIDKVYQSLNDLRGQTNCNIVVLNLNNLHESRPWFDSLSVSKFTQHVQQPHPSTVRVISVGGIGEHVIKALDLIYDLLQR